MWKSLLRGYHSWKYERWIQKTLRPTFPRDEILRKGFQSQCGQDWWVAETLLPGFRNGVFVDIGAHDGTSFSNTWYLETYLGWTGIAVEPNPEVFQTLASTRQCHTVNACVGAISGPVTFQVVSGYSEMLSGILDCYDPRHHERLARETTQHGGTCRLLEVDCMTLQQLLTSHGIEHVDYLSIDTEGSELSILQSIDWTRHSFRIIGVENNYRDFRIPKLLKQHGFRWHSVVGDEFYTAGI